MFEIYLFLYLKRIYCKRVKIIIFVGMFCIFLIFFFLYFGFEFFGRIKWIGVFFVVNESIWEYLKIGFFGGFIFYIIEYIIYGRRFENFVVGKLVVFFLILFLIVVFYFLYIVFFIENLFFDIMIFFLVIIIV